MPPLKRFLWVIKLTDYVQRQTIRGIFFGEDEDNLQCGKPRRSSGCSAPTSGVMSSMRSRDEMKMELDFETDILDWANNVIVHLGHMPSGENKPTPRLAQVFNILRNRIPPIPRKVKVAKEFSCPELHLNGYNQIVSEIESGIDLTPRCSRQQTRKSGYTDPMLLDWGIYHLHLGTDTIQNGRNKGLIQGHKEILFVFVTDEVVYIIDVFDHSSWFKQKVLEIVHDNWPKLLDTWKIDRDVIDLGFNPTDEERKHLRERNVNSPIQLGGNIYLGPGGGLTTAGSGSYESHKIGIVLRAANELRQWVKDNSDQIENITKSKVESLKFDVSRFILSNTYSLFTPISNTRIFISTSDPERSWIHPAQAATVEPIKENYSFYKPGSFSGILVEKY